MFTTTALLAVTALLHQALAAPNAPELEKRGMMPSLVMSGKVTS